MELAALARGDLTAARRWADEAVSASAGWHRMYTLAKRVRVAIALGEPVQAERDAHHALAIATDIGAHLVTAGRFGVPHHAGM
jgi:hypothetical protein